MAYPKERIEQAKALIGKRIEMPVHYDCWMQGARHGTVVSLKWRPVFDSTLKGYYAGNREVCGIKVRVDHPQVKKLKTVWMLDLDYVKEA